MPLQALLLRVLCIALCATLLYGAGAWQHGRRGDAGAAIPAALPAAGQVGTTGAVQPTGAWTLQAQGFIPMPEQTSFAHGSNLLVMPPGDPAALTAFWVAGDGDAAPNVRIAAAQWERATGRWTRAAYVVNPQTMAKTLGFGVRYLRNPVAWMDRSGRTHLFVVASGWGGFASRVVHLRQSGEGTALSDLRFVPERVMPLSWLWNISYQTRNAPMHLTDGGMLLPVSFDGGTRHASTLRFDARGEWAGAQRLTRRLGMLQPAIVSKADAEWMAFMPVRRPGGKVAVAQTRDSGARWSSPPDLLLNNPESSLSALALGPSYLLLAHNTSGSGRHALILSTSADGLAWKSAATLADGPPGSEFSDPGLFWADGALWVTFTDNRGRIAWQRFAPGP